MLLLQSCGAKRIKTKLFRVAPCRLQRVVPFSFHISRRCDIFYVSLPEIASIESLFLPEDKLTREEKAADTKNEDQDK